MRTLHHVLLSALLGAAPCVAQTRYLTANLDGAQETPPVVTAAKGWAIVTARDATMTVDVFVESTGLVATAAHVHAGAVGVPGGIKIPLAGGPTRWQALGVALGAADYAALIGGGMYANLHTLSNPNGLIRGQVVAPNTRKYVAVLNGAQETPPVVTAATGTGVAFLHEPDNVLVYTVSSTGLVNVTNAHIHQAPAGVPGGVIHPLRGSAGSYCGVSHRLTAAQLTALNASGLYFNIHTMANGAGEIRGQILPATSDLTCAMDGSQETPPVVTTATGMATFRLNPDNTMTYNVATLNLVGGGSAHVHKGAVGVFGAIIIVLNGGPTVWSGTTGVLTPAEIADAVAGLWYVNVHTGANPLGEIRGQLAVQPLPTVLGAGCAGSGGTVAEMNATGVPSPGDVFGLQVINATAARAGAILLGTAVFNPPIDLAVLKMNGCFLIQDLPMTLPILTDGNGCATVPLGVPLVLALVNGVILDQAAILDPGPTVLGVVMSNALRSTIL